MEPFYLLSSGAFQKSGIFVVQTGLDGPKSSMPDFSLHWLIQVAWLVNCFIPQAGFLVENVS